MIIFKTKIKVLHNDFIQYLDSVPDLKSGKLLINDSGVALTNINNTDLILDTQFNYQYLDAAKREVHCTNVMKSNIKTGDLDTIYKELNILLTNFHIETKSRYKLTLIYQNHYKTILYSKDRK